MEQFMMLDQYLSMGGKIKNLNLDETKLVFYRDENSKKKIKSIKGALLTFDDDTSKEYSPMWIQTVVDLALDQKYL